MSNLVTLNQAEHTRPIRKIGRSIITNQGGAAHQGGSQNKRACDPSHIRGPAKAISWSYIEMDRCIMGNLQRKTAMGMDCTLRLTCSA